MIVFFKFPLRASLGGAELHTLQLAESFRKQGRQVKLFTSDDKLFRLFESRGLPRKRIFAGWEPTSKWSLLLWPLTYLIAGWKLKKIIAHCPAGSIFYCQSLTEKLILTPHLTSPTRGEESPVSFPSLEGRVIWIEHKIPGKWLKWNLLKFRYLRLAKKIKVITVSNFAKQEFVKFGVPEKNIEVVYPTIFTPVIARREAPRQSQFTIGTLGRLDPEKGILEFLNAVIPALTRNPSWRILIAGEGSEKIEIEKLAQKNRQIKLLGFVHDLDKFFSQISVLAYLTKVPESFGMAAAEAAARGIPVVASNLGALPEIISPPSVSPPREGEIKRGLGFLVKNDEEWTTCLEKLSKSKN